MNAVKEEMSKVTNLDKKSGSLADMLAGADVFIGVSAPGAVTTEMVKTMAEDAIIFACANPTPEIFPEDAKAGGAKVVSTGRSDFPNQINNGLAFPDVYKRQVYYYGDWFRDVAEARMKDYLVVNGAPDIVFAFNDEMAYGCLLYTSQKRLFSGREKLAVLSDTSYKDLLLRKDVYKRQYRDRSLPGTL